jgi:hypothetical protein
LPWINECGTNPALCLGAITFHGHRVPRAPLPGSGVARAWVSLKDTSEGVTPPSSLLRAHAPVHPLLTFSALAYTPGLRRLLPAPAGRWTFPTLSPHSLQRRLDPSPAVSLHCSYPFLPTMIKVKTLYAGFFLPAFSFTPAVKSWVLLPCDDSFESPFVHPSRSTRPMTPSGCVRGRSATPRPRGEKVLYNLLSVVWPQVSTCGKKEPMSTH